MPAALVLALALSIPVPLPDPTGDPFDLTFVPADAPTRLIGLRPAALTALPGVAEQADPLVTAALAQLVTGVGGEGTAANPPPLGDIRQLLCEGIRLDFPTADRAGQFGAISGWYVVRTAAPFDWAGLAAAWFPAGVSVEYAGQSYRKCPLNPEAIGATDGQTSSLSFMRPTRGRWWSRSTRTT